MATVKPGSLSPDALPRNRGRFLVKPRGDGYVAQAWPKPQGYPTQWKRQFTVQQFRFASRWSANMEPMSWQTAEFMARDTMYLPRDLLIRAMYGTLYEIELPSGELCEVVPKSAPEEPTE